MEPRCAGGLRRWPGQVELSFPLRLAVAGVCLAAAQSDRAGVGIAPAHDAAHCLVAPLLPVADRMLAIPGFVDGQAQ